MNIIVDFDGTITNTDKAVLTLYREMTKDFSTELETRKGWDYEDMCPLWTSEQISEAFANPRLFEVMELQPNAKDVLLRLSTYGHNLTICTVHNPEGILYKAQFIKKHLPFINQTVFIDNGVKMNKSMIHGDVIIDDNIFNLKSSNCRNKICFGKYDYNINWDGKRANNWVDVNYLILDLMVNDDWLVNGYDRRSVTYNRPKGIRKI